MNGVKMNVYVVSFKGDENIIKLDVVTVTIL